MTKSKKAHVSSYIAQYPIQSKALFTLYSLADLFNRRPSRLLWEVFSDAAISRRLLVYKYSSLSICRRVKKNLLKVLHGSTGFEPGYS